ncbi:MAG: hypothetical protein RBT80_24560 [Candidatus Vecturithrix sp.]|jgi:hypothetical protein|nr:hypothetical protein [Candidatus Vecturithrix sp.]
MQSKFYKLKDALEQVDALQFWSTGVFTCYACRKSVKGDKFTSRVGSVCLHCVESELKKTVRAVNLTAQTIPNLLESLAAGDAVRMRLTVLWRAYEVLQRVTREAPDQLEQLKKLLIRNLGYVQAHPLAQTVRQAAFQACADFGKPLTPLLLAMCEPTPWQFYANVLMILGKINPQDPAVYALLEKAALDPNAEIRKRAQAILLDIAPEKFTAKAQTPEQTEQQKRLIAVVNRLNPALRSLVKVGMDEKQKTPSAVQSPQAAAHASSANLTRVETLINQMYTADALKQLYSSYIQSVDFHGASLRLHTNVPINKLKKAELTHIMAAVLANAAAFQLFFKSLPPAVQSVFQELVWQKGERDVEFLEKEYNVRIVKAGEYGRGNVQDLENAYALFRVRSQYDWRSYSKGSRYKYFLSIPDELRPIFKAYLPLPEGYDLCPLEEIEPTAHLYQNQDRILYDLKLYHSYIAQGNLKYSQNSGKLLKSSLSQMMKYCHITEFYDSNRKDLQYLKTSLIIDFLQGIPLDINQSPEKALHRLFSDFFQDVQPKAKKLYEFLYHLKGGYYEHQYEQRQKRVKTSLLQLLKTFPASQWVSLENLQKYCLYREIDLDVVSRTSYGSDLYFNIKVNSRYRDHYERTYARGAYYHDAVTAPFLNTMLFLFATFGVVDIAYDLPVNKALQEREADYLSPFDGLRYVRLTPLGAYVLGLTQTYQAELEEHTANILLDEKRLIMTIEGSDPLKTLVLEKLAEKISDTCYKVNYQSFLKDCLTQQDIKQKITLFHEQIAANPPKVWQEFLDEVQQKMNPLRPKTNLAVFQLQQSKELIALVARDDVLKRYILKAEGYHVLIETKHVAKVKKRLEEFGYFIDNI